MIALFHNLSTIKEEGEVINSEIFLKMLGYLGGISVNADDDGRSFSPISPINPGLRRTTTKTPEIRD